MLAVHGAAAVMLAAAAGCDDTFSAEIDSFPIALTRAPLGNGLAGDGALVATAAAPDTHAESFAMLVGTGTPLTLRNGTPSTPVATEKIGFDLLDPLTVAADPLHPAVRARFRDVSILRLPLEPLGDRSFPVGGILGGDILRRYSVDIRFGAACGTNLSERCSTMTFWGHHGADLGYLQDSGYAVLRFSLAGGGEVTAEGDPDVFGQRGPLVLAPTRIVLRSCAVSADFSPDMPREMCCREPDAARLASGVDLALLLDTGVGPLVLSSAAWARIKARLPTEPVPASGVLQIATWPVEIPAIWSTIPRFALVDLEIGAATDPGPCVELRRAQRIEQVSAQLVKDAQAGVASTVCTQPCDNDPREPEKAQNSAAYLELTGTPAAPIPVAVIADDEPYLQGLRFDVRPEGPELDGVLGAGALGRSRVEIDYLSGPPRAIFSCELDVPRSECWAAARCPRLPDASFQHVCFGLGYHGLAASCEPSGC
jgi:hypothetical protein